MNESEGLWLRTLQRVADKAAHEIKDSLNGVSLNLEVVQSRSRKDGLAASSLMEFATAAATQMETLSQRAEALLFLARRHQGAGAVDVAQTLRQLATLLVPAATSDRMRLTVTGTAGSAPTTAPADAVRLGLAAGLLALMEKGGSGRCRLESDPETVVRFSHESAETCSLDAAIAASLAAQNIVIQRADRESATAEAGNALLMVFPGF